MPLRFTLSICLGRLSNQNRSQPRFYGASAIKTSEAAIRADEHFLHQVLCIGPASRERDGGAKQSGAVAIDQLMERPLITACRGTNQLQISCLQ